MLSLGLLFVFIELINYICNKKNMIPNQYTYEYTDDVVAKLNNFINNFSMANVKPSCLINGDSRPIEAAAYYEYLRGKVSECKGSIAMYEMFKKLMHAWEAYVVCVKGDDGVNFDISNILRFA